MNLILFCEAQADLRTATGLVDRVLREEGPTWLADLLDAHPEAVRTWISAPEGRSFFDLHTLSNYVKALGVRVPYGHFDGKPGAAGAQMARTIFTLVRAMGQRANPDDTIASVVIVWDMDDQGDARRTGLHQARTEARRWAPFAIVLGCPDPMREAWVLAGFEPESSEERSRLDDERRELGFSPCDEAHLLTAKDEQAKRSPKRVLHHLTGGDPDREARSWTHTPLARLRERGEQSGLRAFLDEVKAHIVEPATRKGS